MAKENEVTKGDIPSHPHTHSLLLSEVRSPLDHSMCINPLEENYVIVISQATLKLLDSFCGSKTYDEVAKHMTRL
jgi:hypothetical protein